MLNKIDPELSGLSLEKQIYAYSFAHDQPQETVRSSKRFAKNGTFNPAVKVTIAEIENIFGPIQKDDAGDPSINTNVFIN